MNKLNRKVEYALMGLKVVSEAQVSHLVSAKDICEKTGSPFDATSRVMQLMVNQGWLKSVQGAQGGYMLLRSLNDISLYDLISTILGPFGITKCINEPNCCDLIKQCNIFTPVSKLNTKLMAFYKTVTLSEILESEHQAVQVNQQSKVENQVGL